MSRRARAFSVASRAVVAALFLGACRGGCGPAPLPGAKDPVLRELPAGTRLVAAVDVARIRATSLWSKLAALAEADADPQDRARLAALTAHTGLDPLRQITRIVAAFPDSAREQGQFALTVDGEGFDEQRLVAYARQESAATIEAQPFGRRTLWAGKGPSRTAGFFVGSRRFVLGAGGWAQAMAELEDRPRGMATAADNEELAHFCARIDRRRALWFAAIVPLDVRQLLLADPRHDSAASVTRLAFSADLGPALAAELLADLSNDVDARALVQRIETTVREAKRNARVLILGLGPYLDAISARADGPTLRVTLSLGEPQVRDLVDRLGNLARLGRAPH